MQILWPYYVYAVEGTEGSLTRSVNSSDTTVYFSNSGTTCSTWASFWSFTWAASVAFNTDNS